MSECDLEISTTRRPKLYTHAEQNLARGNNRYRLLELYGTHTAYGLHDYFFNCHIRCYTQLPSGFKRVKMFELLILSVRMHVGPMQVGRLDKGQIYRIVEWSQSI